MSEESPVPAESHEPDQPIVAGSDDVAVFKRAIEAIVMVAHDPVPPDLMAQLLEQPVASVERWCDELQAEYAADGRGFQLARVAGGYRYQTHPDETPYVERFVLNDQRARLSGAALETLAIISYKQPISRAQVASIRGVDPDGVIRTLAARGYIDEVGRDDGPGQAVLFGTTPLFLEKLGLDSLDDLPPIAEFIPDADVVEALEHGLRVRPEIEEIATTELVSEADAQINAPVNTPVNGALANGAAAGANHRADADDDETIEAGDETGGDSEEPTEEVIIVADERLDTPINTAIDTAIDPVSEPEFDTDIEAVIDTDIEAVIVDGTDRAAVVFESLRAEHNNGDFVEIDHLDEIDRDDRDGPSSSAAGPTDP